VFVVVLTLLLFQVLSTDAILTGLALF